MKKTFNLLLIGFLFILFSCAPQEKPASEKTNGDEFSFAFLTDIHVQPERQADKGYEKAISKVNELNPDFVLTGGDLIMDALGQSYERADSLYDMYYEISKKFNMPVYNTLGNHEVFGLYEDSGIDPLHPDYGYNMFRKRLGQEYYSFDHKGWHFIVLNSVGMGENRRYYGHVDSIQMEWIRRDLTKVDSLTPIAVSVHIPFITSWTQLRYGTTAPNEDGVVITNGKEVLSLFADHNLKLVLQGHLHFLEDIYVRGTHFITAGAVSARWWSGPVDGLEEGFLMVHVDGDDFEWEYVDYGWEVLAEK